MFGNCPRQLILMGYNARNDEIRDNVTRMRREWEAQRNALATARRFNAIRSAKGYVWFWPKIAAALTSKHHWLIIACDSCGTVVDLDLRVKPRDPEASVRVARPRQTEDMTRTFTCLVSGLSAYVRFFAI
jgi:hypothetical protein